jgi:flagellar hook protein FlgE
MLRSMFTAISSLFHHQTYMDTISNNLANVNTPGFKSSKISFEDQFSQTLAYGAAPSDTRGGLNPTQIGLGVRLGSIARSFTQGSLVSTGRNLDLAIQGDGFFIYQDPNSANNRLYSRDGSLQMDSEGYLVSIAGGLRIMGWMANTTTGVLDTGPAPAAMQIPLNATKARATSNAIVAGNLDARTVLTSDPNFDPTTDTYTATIGVYDSLGELHSIAINFTRTANGTWEYNIPAAIANGSGGLAFDANGVLSGAGSAGEIAAGNKIIQDVTLPGSNGAANIVLDIDVSSLTQMSDDSNAALVSQNGLAAGSVQNFIVDANNGDIYAVYGNGLQDRFGRIAPGFLRQPRRADSVGA